MFASGSDRTGSGGQQDCDDGKWALIVGEELGEAFQASLQGMRGSLTVGLVQLAAVVVAWLEAIERRGDVD